MPKRKAETSPTGGGGGGAETSSTPKKSKKELRAEATARARAWHESRNGGGGGGGGNAAAKSTPSSSSPVFSAGKATPPSKSSTTSASSKRRRTPTTTTSTNSTSGGGGGGGATAGKGKRTSGSIRSGSASSPAISEKSESTTPVKKSRRSSVGTNASKFEFVASTTTTQSPSTTTTSEIKQNRKAGLEAIRKLKLERESKGLPTVQPHPSAEQRQLKSPTIQTKNMPPNAGRAVDPPPSAAMSAAAAAAEASESFAARATNTATMASAKQPSPSAQHSTTTTTTCKMPASIASLFSQKSPLLSKTSPAGGDPPYQQFDPTQPFPTSGYKLRTAAYCGCGPTPNSNATVSARGTTTTASSFCINSTRTVPFTTPRVQYSNDGSVLGSEATSEGGDDDEGEEEDERKMPYQLPSPPGRHPQHRGEPLPDAGLLANAILRARGILSSAAAGSQRRREGMGIRGLSSDDTNGSVRPTNYLPGEAAHHHAGGGNGASAAGLTPSRNDVLPMASSKLPKAPIHHALYDGNGGGAGSSSNLERSPMDPPTFHHPASSSSAIPYASTVQKFRNATGNARTQQPFAAVAITAAVPAEPTSTTRATPTAMKTSNEPKPSVTATNLESLSTTTSWMTKCRSVGKSILVLLVGISILHIIANSSSDRHILSSDHISRTDEEIDFASCFINHPHTMEVENSQSDGDQHLHHQCEGGGKPCPQWGRCHEGKLIDCSDGGGEASFEGFHRFVPSVKGDRCVPSHQANMFVQIVQEVLLQMTSDLICQSGWNDDDTTFPLFSMDSVADKMRDVSDEENPTLVISSELLRWLSPVFDSNLVRFGSLSGENGSEHWDAIGLGQDVPPNSLPLPMRCRLNLVLWELLGYLFQSSWGLAWFLVKKLFRFATSYPIYSIGAIALGKMVQYIKRRRNHRARVRELHGIVIEAVYDRLSECEDHEGYAALMLRDDVGHEMYPTNFSQRIFMNDYVWPRVALEIKADNRVRKFRKLINGKELEHWDFAVQSKRGRRLRKSIGGTPVLGSNASGGANSEDVTPKRDP